MAGIRFAAVINCMDGRTQMPVIEVMKKYYAVDYVDMITEPGPSKVLSDNSNQGQIDSIKYRLGLSVERHGTKTVGIVAHFDCAANPVEEKQHLKELDQSVQLIKSWGLGLTVVKIWIDEHWKAHVLS